MMRRDRERQKGGLTNGKVVFALFIGVSCGFLAAIRSAGIKDFVEYRAESYSDSYQVDSNEQSPKVHVALEADVSALRVAEARIAELEGEVESLKQHLDEAQAEVKKLKIEPTGLIRARDECRFILEKCKHDVKHAQKQG
eukprot:CAMPEP_0197863192 /NCGR_PEP_ID=MMETSP1438-20131217/40485_1 /TAXON_ID=1461541 /ORGANISM="Pterosperma sp., Strain CCMP1384" /LENGTH=139 /DNA_ID=CAMNT_0043481005 /DNA_START=251 /DNA_END=666 /DNA_ORIENTATION=+